MIIAQCSAWHAPSDAHLGSGDFAASKPGTFSWIRISDLLQVVQVSQGALGIGLDEGLARLRCRIACPLQHPLMCEPHTSLPWHHSFEQELSPLVATTLLCSEGEHVQQLRDLGCAEPLRNESSKHVP